MNSSCGERSDGCDPPAALRNETAAKDDTSSSPRVSCWQIPDGVGDRVRTQVILHELTEQFDDRPWAREQADAFDLFGSVLCYKDGDLDQIAVNATVEGDGVFYRPSGF